MQIPLNYEVAAAAMIDLPIPDEYRDAVHNDFLRAQEMAAFLMAFPLDQKIEAAPVFLP